MQDVFRRLFSRRFRADPVGALAVAPDGSQRRMVRLQGPRGETAIAVVGPDPEENRAFLSFTRSFRELGLPVPEILAVEEAAGVYLVEDLGDTTLFRALTEARAVEPTAFPGALVPAYRRVLEFLPRFQVLGGRAVDFAVAHPRAAFDRQSMQWDLDYFKYHFAKLAHVPFNEDRLQRDFDRLIEFLLAADTRHFLYRDFQSRNVMLRGGEPWFIDYQGGRRGALAYDVASLLYDAKAAIPGDVREALLAHYLDALGEHLRVEEDEFRRQLRGYVLVRILQALGAYGYRGFYERKPHFLQSVPHAARNLEGLLADGLLPFETPELRAVLERICARDDLRRMPELASGGLTVRVGSFSYRHGYPEDETGHGGGFVFDCRALPNPGLEPRFQARSGLDADVVAFLEGEAAVGEFLDRTAGLVLAQVEAYLARGYTSLDVHFGCTGGQHRSVYAAEALARLLRARFPDVGVRLRHREAARWRVPPPATGVPGPTSAERA